ncbi:hypothetical protein MSAN_01570500 [Mycena sanguinolenta]|uniref:Uncharacterized protein n=1 Tax=Mycena sanguinolenta TaxID=230812 RepID=A0A8H7CXW1_9AGAR|nr:hypothetical protein MSAN_01570500 [Mycena sanguinolenta]
MADAKGKEKAREGPHGDEPESPQLIRITNHGKITTWVAFALDFLDKHESIPIVLHTLPAAPKPESPEKVDGTGRVADPPSFSHTASTVPRLISVVEIIKREYLKKLDLENSSTLLGLHQYNEIGTLEELGINTSNHEVPQDADTVRSQTIAAALEGKKYLKTKQTPYMKITLSRVELPGLIAATYQPPTARKLSKSAKARAKRREKKATDEMVE